MSSSTSSSEPAEPPRPRYRVPAGAIWGVAIFLAIELGARLAPASWFLAFDQHDYATKDTLDYSAVEVAMTVLEPPEVAVVGTSRAREAVPSPDLAGQLQAMTGRPVEVRNYGVAAGRIDVTLALVERLAAERALPRVLVIALDASDFRDRAPAPQRLRFVDLMTLPDDIARNGWPSERDLTDVVGNSIPLRLVELRDALRYQLVQRGDLSGDAARTHNAAFGGTSYWYRLHRDAEAEGRRPKRMSKNPERILEVASGYSIRDRQLARLDATVAHARAHGVVVVLAEIPFAPRVRDVDNVAPTQARLRDELRRLVDADACVLAWTWSDGLREWFQRNQYRDPSHLSASGATRFTQLLAPVVARAVAAASACARRR